MPSPIGDAARGALAPYWGGRLGKQVLSARQLSARGGSLRCELAGTRVVLYGHAVKFMQGQIELPV